VVFEEVQWRVLWFSMCIVDSVNCECLYFDGVKVGGY